MQRSGQLQWRSPVLSVFNNTVVDSSHTHFIIVSHFVTTCTKFEGISVFFSILVTWHILHLGTCHCYTKVNQFYFQAEFLAFYILDIYDRAPIRPKSVMITLALLHEYGMAWVGTVNLQSLYLYLRSIVTLVQHATIFNRNYAVSPFWCIEFNKFFSLYWQWRQ